MGTSQASLYLPWADDALVRGESLYAVLNKGYSVIPVAQEVGSILKGRSH